MQDNGSGYKIVHRVPTLLKIRRGWKLWRSVAAIVWPALVLVSALYASTTRASAEPSGPYFLAGIASSVSLLLELCPSLGQWNWSWLAYSITTMVLRAYYLPMQAARMNEYQGVEL